jgi:hypothetical protein
VHALKHLLLFAVDNTGFERLKRAERCVTCGFIRGIEAHGSGLRLGHHDCGSEIMSHRGLRSQAAAFFQRSLEASARVSTARKRKDKEELRAAKKSSSRCHHHRHHRHRHHKHKHMRRHLVLHSLSSLLCTPSFSFMCLFSSFSACNRFACSIVKSPLIPAAHSNAPPLNLLQRCDVRQLPGFRINRPALVTGPRG